ncbi:hypothetical protein HH214_15540 [Mucilaginibacter robiniae]|uniref:Uncharacterized protein n=1 Tax=Mucilaginibacter robiniae TaxID=2728022 RepID=A0A7L5E1E0_9SPHI|nr:hypothetical protein [Mucilaginibacter robiniae]QJD97182.1 hypothetical protein HH214_15540 [Mucilaginibacter robiniae]
MNATQQQRIKSVLHTLTELVYSLKKDKASTPEELELLEGYEQSLLNLIDINLFDE